MALAVRRKCALNDRHIIWHVIVNVTNGWSIVTFASCFIYWGVLTLISLFENITSGAKSSITPMSWFSSSFQWAWTESEVKFQFMNLFSRFQNLQYNYLVVTTICIASMRTSSFKLLRQLGAVCCRHQYCKGEPNSYTVLKLSSQLLSLPWQYNINAIILLST